MNKKGVSLVVMVITIVVMIILILVVTMSTLNSVISANEATFAKDLTEIEEGAKGYYILNGKLPIIEGELSITSSNFLSSSTEQSKLSEELTENGDLNSVFFVVDLAKINISKTTLGTKSVSDDDVFIISDSTMNVYYKKGVKIGDEVYFSLSSRLTNVVKEFPKDESPHVTTVTSGGIKITKPCGWTNKMGVKIQVNLQAGEGLYMDVLDTGEKVFPKITGDNVFYFDKLSSIKDGSGNAVNLSPSLGEIDDIIFAEQSIDERYIDILKKDSSNNLLGKVRIDLSNYSTQKPTLDSITKTSFPEFNQIKFNLTSSESGIKEVRYEYLKKTGNVNYYDGISDFDEEYMLNNSKKAELLNQNNASANIPTDVIRIKVIVIDKAGNINLYTQSIT